MSIVATAWVMSESQAGPTDRVAFLALVECSGSGNNWSGVLLSSDEQAAVDLAKLDLSTFRQCITNLAEMGELTLFDPDRRLRPPVAFDWRIPALFRKYLDIPELVISNEDRQSWTKRHPNEVVYVIGSTESSLVKIGRSVNIDQRLRSIQSMSPVPLTVLWTIPGSRSLELWLHITFAEYRSHGEWFNFGDRDPLELIKKAARGGPR